MVSNLQKVRSAMTLVSMPCIVARSIQIAFPTHPQGAVEHLSPHGFIRSEGIRSQLLQMLEIGKSVSNCEGKGDQEYLLSMPGSGEPIVPDWRMRITRDAPASEQQAAISTGVRSIAFQRAGRMRTPRPGVTFSSGVPSWMIDKSGGERGAEYQHLIEIHADPITKELIKVNFRDKRRDGWSIGCQLFMNSLGEGEALRLRFQGPVDSLFQLFEGGLNGYFARATSDLQAYLLASKINKLPLKSDGGFKDWDDIEGRVESSDLKRNLGECTVTIPKDGWIEPQFTVSLFRSLRWLGTGYDAIVRMSFPMAELEGEPTPAMIFASDIMSAIR